MDSVAYTIARRNCHRCLTLLTSWYRVLQLRHRNLISSKAFEELVGLVEL